VNFEASTAVMFQVEVFWVVKPCSVLVGYQCSRGPCCPWMQSPSREADIPCGWDGCGMYYAWERW